MSGMEVLYVCKYRGKGNIYLNVQSDQEGDELVAYDDAISERPDIFDDREEAVIKFKDRTVVITKAIN